MLTSSLLKGGGCDPPLHLEEGGGAPLGSLEEEAVGGRVGEREAELLAQHLRKVKKVKKVESAL